MAGWVVRKVAEEPEVRACADCERLLLRTNDSEHSYAKLMEEEIFIAQKKYSSSANLLFPSEAFKNCILKCKGVIKKILPAAWSTRNLVRGLKASLRASGALSVLTQIHPTHSKAIEQVALQKFVMCRMDAELRAKNQEALKNRKRRDTTAKRKLKCFTG